MGYQTDLLQALKDWGLNVIEVNGWQTRGSSSFNPKGSVNHHTAGSRNGTCPSLGILVNGRADLPGPLCNVAQSRLTAYHPEAKLDDVYLVAAGRANHAGRGGWNGLVGNSSVFGLEIEHVGYLDKEPFDDRRLETAYRVHRAFAEVGGFSADNVCQHFEWAPRRKIDFAGANGAHFRRGVAAVTESGLVLPPQPAPAPAPSSVLRNGSRGEAVKQWQRDLNTVAGAKLTVDGVFGPATENATKSFQKFFGLTVDGVVGPKTSDVMLYVKSMAREVPVWPLRPGSYFQVGARGTYVKRIQRQLNATGAKLVVDGVYGAKTAQAVKGFQSYMRLSVDGVVGPVTWKALFSV